MALVVFLRGVNVGGHRRFRPSALAAELKHLGAVNIGAAGTFVIRARITRANCAPNWPTGSRSKPRSRSATDGRLSWSPANLTRTNGHGPMSFASSACSPDRRPRTRTCRWHFPGVARGSSGFSPGTVFHRRPISPPHEDHWPPRRNRSRLWCPGDDPQLGHDCIDSAECSLQGRPADSRTTTQSRTRPHWLGASVTPWPVCDRHCRSCSHPFDVSTKAQECAEIAYPAEALAKAKGERQS